MDERVKELVTDLQQGYLTRRGFLAKASALGLSTAAALRMLGGETAEAQAPAVQPKRWQRARGGAGSGVKATRSGTSTS
jgi:hypothetical protein